MNSIKKQFKDFWAFNKLIRYGVNRTGAGVFKLSYVWLNMIIMFGTFFICSQIMNGASTWFAVDIWFFALMVSALMVGSMTASKPSLISVAPFSPKQKVVYSYLSALLTALIIIVFWVAFMTLFFLLIALMTFVFTGENVLIAGTDETLDILKRSAYGNAFCAEFEITMAFGVFAISHINGNKNRIIASLCFLGGMEVLALILTTICGCAATGERKFWFAYDVFYGIDFLNHKWLVLVVGGILSVCAIAASLYTTIKRHKSSKI